MHDLGAKDPYPGYRQLLASYLGPQRKAVGAMSVLLVASIMFQLVGPQVAAAFIDAVGKGAPEVALVRLAFLFLIASLIQQGLYVLAEYWGERVAWTATNALRADLAAHLLGLDFGFHKSRTPGELIERVDGDVSALAGFFSRFAVQLAGSSLLLVGVVVALFRVDVRLGIAFSVFTAFALAVLIQVRRFGTASWHQDRAASAAFYGFLGEVLTATEDLRSAGAVPYILRRFLGQIQDWWPVTKRARTWGQAVMMAAIVLFAIADGLSFGLTGHLYQVGAVSMGEVYLVLAYVAMLAAPIETIRTQLQDLQRADAAIGRVRELFSLRSRLIDGTETLPEGSLAVEFCDVSFAYSDDAVEGDASRVLDGVSFRLEPGRVLGVIGRTGSGKSTLARLLFRLYDPDVGAVLLGGRDLRRVRLADLRAHVGLVTQDVQLFDASLRDNVTFFDPTVSDARLLDLLETLGLGPWVDRLPNRLDTPISAATLSAAEAQLVALVRVFLKDPGLVILDEASSRLDPITEAILRSSLDRLLAGRTVIVIAHRLAPLERVNDVLVLEDGRVVEHGTRTALATDPRSRFATLRQNSLLEVPR